MTLSNRPQVADAISMLRLRFGEPVRFKFLIGEQSCHASSLRRWSVITLVGQSDCVRSYILCCLLRCVFLAL